MKSAFLIMMLAASISVKSLKDVLASPDFHWVRYESASFDFYIEQGSYAEREIGGIQQRMEEARAHIDELLGLRVEGRLPVFLVTNRNRNKLIVGYATNAVSTGEYQSDTFSETVNAAAGHETMHILSARLWGMASGPWISEGLAVYSDDEWSLRPLHNVARSLLERHQLIPMKDLVKKRGSIGNDEVTYPQSGSFVKFLYETHGRDMVKRLWQHKPDTRELAALEQEWLAMLRNFQSQ